MINQAFINITGYSHDELISQQVGIVTHSEDKERIKTALQDMDNPERPSYSDEFRIINKKGNTVWVYMVANQYYNTNGEFEYAMCEFYDITDRKNAEIQLREYSMYLEKYSIELEETNAAKDKFFSIVSHDLRNPFNGLIGISGLALSEFDKYEKENLKHFFEIINEASESGYKLLENLLEWSRIQTGSIKCSPSFCQLETITKETIDIGNTAALKKNILITSQIDREIEIFADYNMIYTVLRNLISNAIKFTPQNGKIIIAVSYIEANSKVAVSVIDNGIGISEEAQKKIFRIDSKISTRGTENEVGTGLGLILCKEFVEKNNGEIKLESSKNMGTKVTFTIPCKATDIEPNNEDKDLADAEIENKNKSLRAESS